GFVMQSFKPSRPQVAQGVVNLFWRKLLFDPGLGGHCPNAIQITRPHAIRSPREQMERRVNLRSAGHADGVWDRLAKLFRDAADGSLASDKGLGHRKSAARNSRNFHPCAPCSRHCSAPNVGVALSSDVSTGDASACPDRTRGAANARSNESRFAP